MLRKGVKHPRADKPGYRNLCRAQKPFHEAASRAGKIRPILQPSLTLSQKFYPSIVRQSKLVAREAGFRSAGRRRRIDGRRL